MRPRSWVVALLTAVTMTVCAFVIANVHGPGSAVSVHLTNAAGIVGMAGTLTSLVALGRLWAKRDRGSDRTSSSHPTQT